MTQTSETSETPILIEPTKESPVELNYTAEELIALVQNPNVGLIPADLFSTATCTAISPSFEGMQLVQFKNTKVQSIDLAKCDARQRHIVEYILQSSVVPSKELIEAVYEMDSNPPYSLTEFTEYVNKVVDIVKCIFSLYRPSADPLLQETQQKIYDVYSPHGLEVLVGHEAISLGTNAITRPNVRIVTLGTSTSNKFNSINAGISGFSDYSAEVIWNKYIETVALRANAARVQKITLQELENLKTVESQYLCQLRENMVEMRKKEVLAETVMKNAKNMEIFLANNSFAASGVKDGNFWGITGWNVVELHGYVGYGEFARTNRDYQKLTRYRLLPPVVITVKDVLITKNLHARWGLSVLNQYKEYFQQVSYDGTKWFNKCIPHQNSGYVYGVAYNQGKIGLSSHSQQSCIAKSTEIWNDLFDVSQTDCVTDYKFLNMFRTLPLYARASDGYGEDALALVPISQKYVDIIRGPEGQNLNHNFITDEDRIEDSFKLICEANSVDAFGFTSKYRLSNYNKSIVIPARFHSKSV
jgi:hypothetical protein